MTALFVSVCLNIVLFCVALGAYAELSAAKLRVKREAERVERWRKIGDDWRELCETWRGHAQRNFRDAGIPITWTVESIEKVRN